MMADYFNWIKAAHIYLYGVLVCGDILSATPIRVSCDE